MSDRNEALRLAQWIEDDVSCEGDAEIAAMLRQLVKEVDAKQAKIDALMLEYCPEEMTQEQIDNWASHQRVVKVGEI